MGGGEGGMDHISQVTMLHEQLIYLGNHGNNNTGFADNGVRRTERERDREREMERECVCVCVCVCVCEMVCNRQTDIY